MLILSLSLSPTAGFVTQSKGDSDPLRPYTRCEPGNDLRLKDITHFKYPGNYREATIGKKRVKISVVDAYRLVYAYADVPHDLVNVKVEQSNAKSYAQDKELIIELLKHQVSTRQKTGIRFTDRTDLHGFAHYATDREIIDVGEVMGTHVLFDDAQHLVVTIYFLNQEKQTNKRRFNSIEEYDLFKNDVLNRYADCLRRAAKS